MLNFSPAKIPFSTGSTSQLSPTGKVFKNDTNPNSQEVLQDNSNQPVWYFYWQCFAQWWLVIPPVQIEHGYIQYASPTDCNSCITVISSALDSEIRERARDKINAIIHWPYKELGDFFILLLIKRTTDRQETGGNLADLICTAQECKRIWVCVPLSHVPSLEFAPAAYLYS